MLIPNSALYLGWFILIFSLVWGPSYCFYEHLVILCSEYFGWYIFSDIEFCYFPLKFHPPCGGEQHIYKIFLQFSSYCFSHDPERFFCTCVLTITTKDLGWGIQADLGICPFAAPSISIFSPLLSSLQDTSKLHHLTH